MDWQLIDTAPKYGQKIYTRRIYVGEVVWEGLAVWRTVTFPGFMNGNIWEPGSTATGWMYPDADKRVPEPTHWLSGAE